MTYEAYAKYRDGVGLNDNQVAKQTGISYGTFTGWKNGEYTPKIDKLLRIASLLGIPVNKVLETRLPSKAGIENADQSN